MKQVKILLCENDIGDEYYTNTQLIDSISDWEEISDEDFIFLKNEFRKIHSFEENNFESDWYGYKPLLIIKDPISVNKRIQSIKDMIDETRKKQELRDIQRKEAEKKKLEKDEQRKKQKELKLLQSLKKKYGD